MILLLYNINRKKARLQTVMPKVLLKIALIGEWGLFYFYSKYYEYYNNKNNNSDYVFLHNNHRLPRLIVLELWWHNRPAFTLV